MPNKASLLIKLSCTASLVFNLLAYTHKNMKKTTQINVAVKYLKQELKIILTLNVSRKIL